MSRVSLSCQSLRHCVSFRYISINFLDTIKKLQYYYAKLLTKNQQNKYNLKVTEKLIFFLLEVIMSPMQLRYLHQLTGNNEMVP